MNKIILIYNELIVIPNSLWEIKLCVKTIAIYIAMQKLKFEFVKPFQTRGCWTRAFELFLVCFFLFSFLPHVDYEKDLFEGICCFGRESSQKRFRTTFLFPWPSNRLWGGLFFSTRNKKETIHMEKLLQCLLFLLLSLFKGSFPSNKKALCGKKIFLINLKVTRPAFHVCILSQV